MTNKSPYLEKIIDQVVTERARQDELHPWDKLAIITCDPIDAEYYRKRAIQYQETNDRLEEAGYASVDSLILEEFYETLSETDPVKQETEAIQLAALAIKFVEWSREKRKENEE